MENKIKITDVIKGLLQKLDFLLHDTEFFVYQYMKMIEWIAPDEEQKLTLDDLQRLDKELLENFQKQHDLITQLLRDIIIDNDKMLKDRENLQNLKDDQEMTPDKLTLKEQAQKILDEVKEECLSTYEKEQQRQEQLTLTRECEEQE